jgi:hypothetical protein
MTVRGCAEIAALSDLTNRGIQAEVRSIGNGPRKPSKSVADTSIQVQRSNRLFVPKAHEEIAGTFAVRAFFIAVISGRFAMDTFDPVQCFVGNCVNAVATLFADDFATTTVCDSSVVTSAATLCTTRNR